MHVAYFTGADGNMIIDCKTYFPEKSHGLNWRRYGVKIGTFALEAMDEMAPRLDVEAVDTTGAGDAFNGGFITALSEGADLFRALRFGNATGALSVTGVGAAVAMPCRRDIDAMFQKHYG